MTYDPAKHFDMRPDGHGGVRLLPRFRFRDVDATFLPRHQPEYPDDATPPQSNWSPTRGTDERMDDPLVDDQEYEEPDKNGPKIIGRLPDPGDQYHYELCQDPDGDGWIVRLVDGPDPDAEQNNSGEWNTVGDRTMKHRLDGKDALLRQMNRDARRYWSRDNRTRDFENTVWKYGPLTRGGRLELRGPDSLGLYSIVLINPDSPDIAPRVPRRANGGDRGYGINTEAAKLAGMNHAARRLWRRK